MPLDKDNFDFDKIYDSGRPEKRKSDLDDFVPVCAGRKLRLEEDSAPEPTEKKSPGKTNASRKKVSTGKKNTSSHVKKASSGEKKASSHVKKASSGEKKASSHVKKASSGEKKDPSQKKKGSPTGTKKRKKKKKTFREELLAFLYLGLMAVGGVCKKLFGSRKKALAVLAVAAGLVLVIWGIFAAVSFFGSHTAFTSEDKPRVDVPDFENVQNREDVKYFLVIGVDKGEQLTDCLWLMCFDNKAHKINVLQIPRDTFVGPYSIAPHKANAIFESLIPVNWCENCQCAVVDERIENGKHVACGGSISEKEIQGVSLLEYFVNNTLHLPVDYYVKFNFEGFENVIDALGGVDIFLEEAMDVYYTKNQYEPFPAGKNHLDGDKALKFMRNRKTYAEGDLGRVKAQRKVINAILQKVEKMSLIDAFNVLKAASGHFETDMSMENMISFLAPVKKCKADGLKMIELPGTAQTVRRRSYYLCDEEKTVQLLNEYMLPYSDKLEPGDIDFPDP